MMKSVERYKESSAEYVTHSVRICYLGVMSLVPTYKVLTFSAIKSDCS